MANATKSNDRGQESPGFKDHGQQGSSQQGGQGAQGAASGIAGSVSGVVDTVKDAASYAMNWASVMAGTAQKTVRDYTSSGVGAVGDLGHNIGSQASHLADEAREYAGVAYDRAGELGRDFTNLVRRNPIPTVLAAVGIGFLLGRTLRS